MGGDMQAQGHAQALINMLDLGANIQAATDMARFRHLQVRNSVLLESPLFDRVGAALSAMGHDVHSVDGSTMGGFQSIMVEPVSAAPGAGIDAPARIYRGGSDHRKDGQAVGW
jgi:gamma-glutamyltranspeptidase/glutathione hydrolase